MKTLAIDVETYSSADLKSCGVYKYVEAVDFTILMFAYSIDGGPVEVIDLAECESIPTCVENALVDPTVLKTAYNASFERTVIAKFLGKPMPPEQWCCTMVKGGMLGLPMYLEGAGKALKLDVEKDATGKQLIRYFSIPCKPTIANGGRIRNLPHHAPDRWQAFKDYCKKDVEVELGIRKKIEFFQIPATEKKLWYLDQRINDRGILLDAKFVKNAIDIYREYTIRLTEEAKELTNLDNPNSPAQLKKWLSEEMNEDVDSLTKISVAELKGRTDKDAIRRVLELRQESAKTSVKKYIAMAKAICKDRRVRGLLQFYGANRTGRWAGRLVQVQNLPKNHLKDLDLARNLVLDNDSDMLENLFGNIPDTLSQLIRTSFIPVKGSRFIVSDFSAIEARVIAWLAGEKWRMDVFNSHGKIYEASASQMFKIPIEQVTKELRGKGKIAELALGYQGATGALITMGALRMGLTEDELPDIVKRWRAANQRIKDLWYDVQDAAWKAIETGVPQFIQFGVGFFVEKNILHIELPNKRRLSYIRPRIAKNRRGDTGICYEGIDQDTKKWGIQETYGGKLVENIVQAIARDCLAEAMLRLDAKGYSIVASIHDEIVAEMPEGVGSIEEMNKELGQPVKWAPNLPLAGAGFETYYYKKDD